jgi:hypothetical protein
LRLDGARSGLGLSTHRAPVLNVTTPRPRPGRLQCAQFAL